MKKTIYILLALATLCLSVSGCIFDDYAADFDFTVTTPAYIPNGTHAAATVQVTPGSPLDGYKSVVLLDGSAIETKTLSFDNDGKCAIDLTSLDLTLGTHTLTVTLSYNETKSRTSEFFFGEDVKAITGTLAHYDIVCTDSIKVTPVLTPAINTDTLKCAILNNTGDHVLVKEYPVGTYTIYTENSLPAECEVEFTTKKASRKFTVTFDIIHAVSLECSASSESVIKTGSSVITAIIRGGDAMEKPVFTPLTGSGDEVTLEISETKKDASGEYTVTECKVSTKHGNPANVTINTAIGTMSKNITIDFFDPATSIRNIREKYEANSLSEIHITPELLPVGSTEEIECECSNPNVRVDKAAQLSFYVTPTDGKTVATADLHFYAPSSKRPDGTYAVEATTHVVLYTDVVMYASTGDNGPGSFRLSFDALKATPDGNIENVTVGEEDLTGKIQLLKYYPLESQIPQTATQAFVKSIKDAPVNFISTTINNKTVYHYDITCISDTYKLLTADAATPPHFAEYYNYMPIYHVVFVNCKDERFHITIKAGPVGADGVLSAYTYNPTTGEKIKITDNLCGFVNDTREHALQVNLLEHYYKEPTVDAVRLIF